MAQYCSRKERKFSLFTPPSSSEGEGTKISPENYLASLLCVGGANVLLELETQYRRTSEIGGHRGTGSRKSITQQSMSRILDNRPLRCTCGATKFMTIPLMAWKENPHLPPVSLPSLSSLLRVTTSCSSLVTDYQDCYNWNHVVWRVQVTL